MKNLHKDIFKDYYKEEPIRGLMKDDFIITDQDGNTIDSSQYEIKELGDSLNADYSIELKDTCFSQNETYTLRASIKGNILKLKKIT